MKVIIRIEQTMSKLMMNHINDNDNDSDNDDDQTDGDNDRVDSVVLVIVN